MKVRTLALVLTMSIPLAAAADPPGPGHPPGPHDDPLAQSFFPPELVMEHQGEIGLQDSQRSAIQEELKKTQAIFLDRQWKLAGEVEKLKKLVDASTIDEAKALDQVDRVLAAEREIKRTQLTLMIRIKNVLTESQRQKLAEMRARTGDEPGR
jgi:Spy/CpxP family protein refolding chaperone